MSAKASPIERAWSLLEAARSALTSDNFEMRLWVSDRISDFLVDNPEPRVHSDG